MKAPGYMRGVATGTVSSSMPACTIAMSACVGTTHEFAAPGACTAHSVVVAGVPIVLEVATYPPYAKVVENAEALSMRIANRLLSSIVP